MKKILLVILLFAFALGAGAEEPLLLVGRIKDTNFDADLRGARVILFDGKGNVADSLIADKGVKYIGGEQVGLSKFYLRVPRVDSTFVFDVICEGFQAQTVSYRLDKIAKRESMREIPTIYLQRPPQELKEITVTASKIKFYHKRDTVVYNADAFQLADGSMLDALIAQLPGVQIDSNGQIKVDGRFVESLLLDGREFFSGNKKLMLSNIGAYTVKNVEVYEGQSRMAQFLGDTNAPHLLTMNVKLKKEYAQGWIVNAQGGYGTENRYLAKLFASWYSPTINVALIGNANNLNDDREPGKDGSWTPSQLPTGTLEHLLGGVNFNYDHPENISSAHASATISRSKMKRNRTTSRANFLPGADTYDYVFADSRYAQTEIAANASGYARLGKLNGGANLYTTYTNTSDKSDDISATFNAEQTNLTMEVLEGIYGDKTGIALEDVINRVKSRTDGWKRRLSGSVSPYVSYKIPKVGDNLMFNAGATYSSEKEELWRDYAINYGADATPAIRTRQYFDNSPNRSWSISAGVSYMANFKDISLSMKYGYEYGETDKDSYMYALERLEDMGVFGILPSGYLASFDAANSYTSSTKQHKHSITPDITWFKEFSSSNLKIRLNPDLNLVSRRLDYWRDNRKYLLKRTDFNVAVYSMYSVAADYKFGLQGNGRNARGRNALHYNYTLLPTLPDLTDMVDVVNDADPLNIYTGNPNLKIEYAHKHLLYWRWTPFSRPVSNTLYLQFTHKLAALTRGYTYDMATGVRYSSMYNVNGNHAYAFRNYFTWQFGSKKQFAFSSNTEAEFARMTDMIGVNRVAPAQYSVDCRDIGEEIKLSWQIGRQTLRLRGDYTNRFTSSLQPGFADISAHHIIYGMSGVFRLPAGLGISTDFLCYTRRGYGLKQLDTTEPVWNMRMSWCPPSDSRWLIALDAFDMLHSLSNVNYAVTATGRTVSYTNTLPRYLLLTVQYRLNIQPRKN